MLSLSGCYVSKQAYYQGKLIFSRQKIDEVLKSDKLTPQEKRKLELSKVVLAFAEKNGLKSEGSYSTFVHTNEPVVSYLVYASPKDKLELKKWWFPIVGSVPYLGFFHKEDRDEEAAKLEKQDLDVFQAGASAFSLLGWFSDPIYSPMLRHKDNDFAHLLFHELTHKTFWAPDKAQFNENLAEFVALTLMQQYVKENSNATDYKLYLEGRADDELFKAWLKELKSELQKLYAEKIDIDQMMKKKSEIFESFLSTAKLPKFKTRDYAGTLKKPWNNARVLATSIYSPELEPFEKAFHCLREPQIGAFLERLKSAIKATGNGQEALQELCK